MKSSLSKFFYSLVCASLLSSLAGIQPVYAASLVVNTNADNTTADGSCTLREAITNANNDAATYPDCPAGAGADTITFAANYTITLIGSQLPTVTTTITINGNGATNTILQANANPNTATYRVLQVGGTGNLTLDNLTIRNGRCNGSCGGLFGSSGGGILNIGGVLTVTNSTLSNNSVGLFGGGISNNGTLTVMNSTLSSNSAGSGGGILNEFGTLTIMNSMLSGNSASTDGGGILNFSTLTVTNSTLFGNSSGTAGGGIYNILGTLTVANSTLSGNSATLNGGGIYNNSNAGATVLYNTIVANSISGSNCFQGGTFTADRYNLDTDGSCDNATQRTTAEINIQSLANNGGPTNTMALGVGSLAIDAGNPTICANTSVSGTDQRGVSRPQGAGCDVGAYEFDDTYPTVVSNSLVANYTIGPKSFTVTFNENVYNPAGNTDTDDATNPTNYRIVEDGADGFFNTASCAGSLSADDTQIMVNNATYNPATFTSTVNINDGTALPNGKYRLFVCGTTSIVDIALTPLNNGASDYIFGFEVTPASSSLPDTGFAPNRITSLAPQPANLPYSNLGDIWLEIPSLSVKTNIVGVPKVNNTWNVDWLGNDTGWLNGTAFPTWDGNSVITGHVYSASGLSGPFVNLKSLKYGDQIIVHLYGQKYIYGVQASRLAKPGTNYYAFQHLKDGSYITLITCQNYDEKSDTYRYRRIIRALLVDVQ